MIAKFHSGIPSSYNHVKKYTFPSLTHCLANVYIATTVNIYFSCVIFV